MLKLLAAAGVGAAIAATVTTRGLIPGIPPASPAPGSTDLMFNVRDQGAVGDGIADDTEALLRTVNLIPASGGIAYLPRGTYRILRPIIVARPNVWLLGSGSGATAIRLGDGANADVVAIGGSSCVVSDLTIDGNKANNAAGNGIFLTAEGTGETVENVTLRSVLIRSTRGAGIRTRSTGGAAIRRVLVQGCVLDDPGAEGIFFARADQSTVTSCVVSRTGKHGILSTQGDEVTVLGNQVLEAGLNKTIGFAHGIAIDGNGGLNPNGRHRIIGNYVFDAYDAGIEVADAVDDVVIEGNTVNGAGVGASAINRYGIYFGGGLAASNKASIRGNMVSRAKANGIEAAGVSAMTRASALILEGNVCHENGENGIYLNCVDDFVVQGNICFNNDDAATGKEGIRLEGASNGLVLGNRCYDNRAVPGQDYGLGVVTSAKNVVVALNDFSGNRLGGIGHASLFAGESRLSENRGYNPLGLAAVAVGPSPWTYTNNDFVREAIYIRGGTVSDISKDGLAGIFAGSNVTVWLEPGESLTVKYSSPPTVHKDRK